MLVLIVTALAHSIRHLPGPALCRPLSNELSFWLLNQFVHAHVDEGLLVEELLVDVTNHLFRNCLHAEHGCWLY